MYARVITLTGVNDIDAAVGFLQQDALSVVRAQRGYKGMSASADRSAGVLGILSLWESEADREASDGALAKTREEARGQFGDNMTVETFEERAVEIARLPEVGCRLIVTRFSMDPAKIDENIEYFKREIVPQITSAPGFRALRNMVDPQTGEGLVGTIWDDEQTMQAAAAAAQERRAGATARGVTFGETSVRDVVFTDFT